MASAENGNQRQQIHHRVLIGAQRQFAAVQILQFPQCSVRVPAQVQHLLGELKQYQAGGG